MGGSGAGGKRRPPSVALCALIGEAPRGDCATNGHLQATMIAFVLLLPSLKITYQRSIQSYGGVIRWTWCCGSTFHAKK